MIEAAFDVVKFALLVAILWYLHKIANLLEAMPT